MVSSLTAVGPLVANLHLYYLWGQHLGASMQVKQPTTHWDYSLDRGRLPVFHATLLT